VRTTSTGVEFAAPLLAYEEPPRSLLDQATTRVGRADFSYGEAGLLFLLQQLTLAVLAAKEYVCLKILIDLLVKSLRFDLSANASDSEQAAEYDVILPWMKVLSCLVLAEVVAGNLNHYFFRKQTIHHTNTVVEFFETWTAPLVAVNALTNPLPRGPAVGWLLLTLAFAAFSRVFGGVGMFHVRGSYTKERLPAPLVS
jgi:hypothetical protein